MNLIRSAAILLLLLLMGCTADRTGQLAEMQAYADGVIKQLVPDKRVDRLTGELAFDGKDFILTGESFRGSYVNTLLDSLQRRFPRVVIRDAMQRLPAGDIGGRCYGIVNIGVANMRSQPKFQAELANQSLLGTVVKIYKQEGDFYYIRNRDDYLGWMSKGSLVPVDSLEARAWSHADGVVCIANYGVITGLDEPDETLSDLVPGSELRRVGEKGANYVLEMPDGRGGIAPKNLFISRRELAAASLSPAAVTGYARRFLGVPYLWGGTSAKGLDCSGFVQTAFRRYGRQLPRDASQMVREGEPVDISNGSGQLLPGDLLFFGSSPERISHVAIYLGDGLYIHSSTMVKINSLDPAHKLFNQYRLTNFRQARRVMGGSQ